MGSFISGIGNAVSNIGGSLLKGVEQGVMGAVNAIAPSVTDALEGVANGAISSLGGGLSSLVGNIPVVGNLLSSLVSKGQQGLTSLADSGIQSLIKGATSGLSNLLNVGGQSTAVPSIANRGTTAADNNAQLSQVIQQILAGIKGMVGGGGTAAASTSGAAATAAPAAAASTTASAATAGKVSVGGVTGSDPASQLLSQFPSMPNVPDNLSDPKVAAQYQQAMTQYQMLTETIQNVLKKMSDISMNSAQNIK